MNNLEKAKQYGEAVANQMFKDMQDLKMQGNNFKWDDFPTMFQEVAVASGLANINRIKNKEEIQEIIKQSYFETAKNLMTEYEKTKSLPTISNTQNSQEPLKQPTNIPTPKMKF